MLPYSAVAAIDYAAYQSRPHHGLSSSTNIGMPVGSAVAAAFTHSWLVSTPSTSIDDHNNAEFMCDDNSNKVQFQPAIVDAGHVYTFFIIILVVADLLHFDFILNFTKTHFK